jgi:hypothetical protein
MQRRLRRNGLAGPGMAKGAGLRVAMLERRPRIMCGSIVIAIRDHRVCDGSTPAGLRVMIVGPPAPVHDLDPLTSVAGGLQAQNPESMLAPGSRAALGTNLFLLW